MIAVYPLETFLDSRPQAPTDLKSGIPTLAIEWDRAKELFWTLRLTEFFGDVSQSWGHQPNVIWRDHGNGALSYEGRPVALGGDPAGICSCTASASGDALAFTLSVTNGSERPWKDCWGWVCLIHRWARSFQANCELPAGTAEDPWVPASSLRAPMERWLKWCPVAGRRADATRIGENRRARWQPHIEARQGAVRAWRVEGTKQQFVQLTSPDAVLLGWSHWPCTDMGLCFGTLNPGQTGRVTGRLEFFETSFIPI